MRGTVRRRPRNPQHGGSFLPLAVVLLAMFTAIATLAVDYGHVQLVKSELQRTADATARGCIQMYTTYGLSYATNHAPDLYSQTNNPSDANGGVPPTVTITSGYWTPATSTFSTSGGSVPAVRVTLSRTKANGNAVPLFWGGMIGVVSTDVSATAIAAQMGGQSGSLNIPCTASLYLAGMPAGSSTVGGDTTSNAAAYQAGSIPVTPGTWISFTNLGGTTSVSRPSLTYVGPTGNSSYPVHHGQSWNNSPNNPGPENGIADAVMYEDAVSGLFLTDSAPNLTAAPATVDWTQSSQKDKPTYSNIAVKQPFLIGNGATTGGVTQSFLVPPGATRLFVGVWDGYQYNNNSGGPLTGTVKANYYVQLVQ